MEIEEEILSLNPNELDTDEETKALIKKVLDLLERVLKENAELRVEIQKLRDENARLKGQKGRPRVLPNVKDEEVTGDSEDTEKKAWHKGSKTAQIMINRIETISVEKKKLPKDAVFKGYRKVTIQELKFTTDNVQFLIARYYSASRNKTYEGDLPAWVDGEFGPNVKSFVMTMYFRGRVTEPKITVMLRVCL